MQVWVGSARSSYGNTAPGDQNGGREVSKEKYYVHSKGWVVLRAKDPAAREKIATAMERACDNNDIGYSQPTRNTLYSNVKPYGFDPAKTTKKVNTDCSALVRVCVNFAGITVGDFITSGEVAALMATGAFEKFTDDAHCKSSDRLLRGDILVTKTKGHTVVVLNDGAKVKDEVQDAPELPAEGNLTVASGTWNLRRGPGTQYGVARTVHGGDRLTSVAVTGWAPVEFGGEVLWISSKAVALLPLASATSPDESSGFQSGAAGRCETSQSGQCDRAIRG